MRAVVQRVSEASVTVRGNVVGSCGRGYLILLGIGSHDTETDAARLWDKIRKLRVFPDGEKPTGATLADVDGEVLIVSQFTLYADCRRGNRPSFTQAAPAELSNRLYGLFAELARKDGMRVKTGVFGADMKVSLTNDGPFTICLDTEDLTKPRNGRTGDAGAAS